MSDPLSRVAEGVFAISKPAQLSSAQVLRDLQSYFRTSRLFAPQISRQQHEAHMQGCRRKRQRRRKEEAVRNVKLGHGGTLDPLATGVLVVGLGHGTKRLHELLGCTKTYETVVLFGRSTDTYDIAGNVVSLAPFQHITKQLVEQRLSRFTGRIKQTPPVFSALRIDGKRAYDYARSGQALPRELQARDMEVFECQLVEWLEGGQHQYRWPATVVNAATSIVSQQAAKSLHEQNFGNTDTAKRKIPHSVLDNMEQNERSDAKMPRLLDENLGAHTHESLAVKAFPRPPSTKSSTSQNAPNRCCRNLSDTEKPHLHIHQAGPLSAEPCSAPAARIKLITSSGFYVRAFAHDLGLACDSVALMASLLRSRQGVFDVSSALTYQDLEEGEDTWGPKLQALLEKKGGDQEEKVLHQPSPKKYITHCSSHEEAAGIGGMDRFQRNSSSECD